VNYFVVFLEFECLEDLDSEAAHKTW